VRGGEIKLRDAKIQWQQLDGRFRVARGCQQVLTGDADLECARSDVAGDIGWPQEHELHIVRHVGGKQSLVLAVHPIPSRTQQLRGGIVQRSLVRHGDP
jgi:hypothetical protein